jgi:hypothetical protein
MEEETRRIGTTVSADVYRRIKVFHALSGKSMSDIVGEAVDSYLSAHEAEIRAFLETEWQATQNPPTSHSDAH